MWFRPLMKIVMVVNLILMQTKSSFPTPVLNLTRLERLRCIIKDSDKSYLSPTKEWNHKIQWAINILDEEIRRKREQQGRWRRRRK
jgi:hypothetical protein